MKLVIPKEILMKEVQLALSKGQSVTLRAKGKSMRPYIREGIDLLNIFPVEASALRKGDSVLAVTDRGDYVLHRIIKINPDSVILKGDGNLYGTERCLKEDVLGRLISITRGEKTFDITTPYQRAKAYLLRTSFSLAHRAYARLRRLLG